MHNGLLTAVLFETNIIQVFFDFYSKTFPILKLLLHTFYSSSEMERWHPHSTIVMIVNRPATGKLTFGDLDCRRRRVVWVHTYKWFECPIDKQSKLS